MRRRAIAALLGGLGLLVCWVAPWSQESAPAKGCNLGSPPGSFQLTRGNLASVMSGAAATVGYVGRDPSVAVVGICLKQSSLPREAPVVQAGASRLDAIGAMLTFADGQTAAYFLYQPFIISSIEVRIGSGVLDATFPPITPTPDNCSLNGTPPSITLIACNSIAVIALQTTVRADADSIEVVDGAIAGASGEALGFYLMDAENSSEGIRLTLGFTPEEGRTTVRVSSIAMRSGAIILPSPRELEMNVSFLTATTPNPSLKPISSVYN